MITSIARVTVFGLLSFGPYAFVKSQDVDEVPADIRQQYLDEIQGSGGENSGCSVTFQRQTSAEVNSEEGETTAVGTLVKLDCSENYLDGSGNQYSIPADLKYRKCAKLDDEEASWDLRRSGLAEFEKAFDETGERRFDFDRAAHDEVAPAVRDDIHYAARYHGEHDGVSMNKLYAPVLESTCAALFCPLPGNRARENAFQEWDDEEDMGQKSVDRIEWKQYGYWAQIDNGEVETLEAWGTGFSNLSWNDTIPWLRRAGYYRKPQYTSVV